jgi:hypothetical protein
MPEWNFTPDSDFMQCQECGDPAFVIWQSRHSKSGLYCSDCACEMGFVLSVKQVAALHDISTTTVRKRCKDRKFDARQDMARTVCPWFVLADEDGKPRRSVVDE